MLSENLNQTASQWEARKYDSDDFDLRSSDSLYKSKSSIEKTIEFDAFLEKLA
jgi:hypothetical protein